MSFWVITSSGKVLSRTTVQRVTNLELQLDENKIKCEAFTTAITERLGGNDMIPIGEDGEIITPEDWDDPNFNKDFVE
jgi:inner membrane protein involved in colicin E2 resistance